ncbi:hypothetical protein [Marinagarivorans algicola]|uniref:hypothetical protein n=1 Tax=Marinagarivorans algicola TaxID=1513270 RepID=UPI0006B509E8|nr:hypothetical protein [Marinagarivorans algicola]
MNSRFTRTTADHSLTADSSTPQEQDTYNPQLYTTGGLLNQTEPLPDQLQALQDELNNPLSLWQELRITPMSGTDYVFIPNFVYQAFGPSYSMTRFITELSCAFGLELERLQVICMAESEDTQQVFSRAIIEWTGGSISHNHQENIANNSRYYAFIDSMYRHSTPLVNSQEH